MEDFLSQQRIIIFILGFVLGAVVILIFNIINRGKVRALANELLSQTEAQRNQQIESITRGIKDSFGALSYEALSKNTTEFLKLANESLSKQTNIGKEELEGKKKLIDQTLDSIKTELQKVQTQVGSFEQDRIKKYGELTNQLKITSDQTSNLQETTNKLRDALANTKVRGQWGERMAEDVLRLAGFIENINYRKQKNLDSLTTRPDFTFMLPKGLIVNMDVKFPLDNYLRYLESENEIEKEDYKKKFLKDVNDRIKEVTTKDYINPENNTLDYVIVFIPNEQVYSFIQENDHLIMDKALKMNVVLCSPITLYAILAVIRQSVENFNLQETASKILSLYGAFNKQWKLYISSFDKLGQKINETQKEYDALTSTRTNQIERPLRKIEELRTLQSIPEASIIEDSFNKV